MGTAKAQGELWGTRAQDWADVQERVALPLYEAVLDNLRLDNGTTVLDIGCGSGIYCEMAARRGARVSGLDASLSLVDIARKRVPEGDFRTGEMEELPYADRAFDVVTGFSSFQFAADPRIALREASRVSTSGAVVIAVFGNPDESESTAFVKAMGALVPPPPPGAPGPFALSADGALESLALQAGLMPGHLEEVACPWVYRDDEEALRGLLSSGPAIRAMHFRGEEVVRSAILRALAPYKASGGGYHLTSSYRYLIATRA